MHIILYGPEGSGKGTQAKMLSEKLGLAVLTSGDLVREAAANDQGAIGDVCRNALSSGSYVDDNNMFILWERRLAADDAKKGWIMDGFPRNRKQAEFLEEKVHAFGYDIDAFVVIKLSEEESLKRLIKRARPLHPGSTELHDSPERIKARLAVFKQGERQLTEYYQNKGIAKEVNGQQSVEDVHRDIIASFPS